MAIKVTVKATACLLLLGLPCHSMVIGLLRHCNLFVNLAAVYGCESYLACLAVQEKPKVLWFTGGIFYGFCIVSLVPVLNQLRHAKPGILVRHSFFIIILNVLK